MGGHLATHPGEEDEMGKDPTPGWSKHGAARAGRTWRPDGPEEDCFYCGVPGCTECGPPPALLLGRGVLAVGDEEE